MYLSLGKFGIFIKNSAILLILTYESSFFLRYLQFFCVEVNFSTLLKSDLASSSCMTSNPFTLIGFIESFLENVDEDSMSAAFKF
jgi:hypothetical protein